MAQTTRARAPKGGVTIGGVFFKGGQFLPDGLPDENKAYKSCLSVPSTMYSAKEKQVVSNKSRIKEIENKLYGFIKHTRNFGIALKAAPQELLEAGLTFSDARNLVSEYNKLTGKQMKGGLFR